MATPRLVYDNYITTFFYLTTTRLSIPVILFVTMHTPHRVSFLALACLLLSAQIHAALFNYFTDSSCEAHVVKAVDEARAGAHHRMQTTQRARIIILFIHRIEQHPSWRA